jgi:hypothetical protein
MAGLVFAHLFAAALPLFNPWFITEPLVLYKSPLPNFFYLRFIAVLQPSVLVSTLSSLSQHLQKILRGKYDGHTC